MKFSVLTTIDNPIDANILRTKLESEDIPCFLNNENITGLLPNLYNILGSGVQVMVPEDRIDEAKTILGLNQGTVKCPNCNSTNVENKIESWWMKIKLLLIGFFVFTPIGNLINHYKCSDCQTEFKG